MKNVPGTVPNTFFCFPMGRPDVETLLKIGFLRLQTKQRKTDSFVGTTGVPLSVLSSWKEVTTERKTEDRLSRNLSRAPAFLQNTPHGR